MHQIYVDTDFQKTLTVNTDFIVKQVVYLSINEVDYLFTQDSNLTSKGPWILHQKQQILVHLPAVLHNGYVS